MRYKFRGKRLDGGEWVYGYYAESDEYGDNGGCEHNYQETITTLYYIVDRNGKPELVLPKSVGQWTGLVDGHGKEIFEGDILSVYIGGTLQDNTYIVEDMCDLHLQMNREDSYYRMTSCRVIGNIHDNPELMEEVKQ